MNDLAIFLILALIGGGLGYRTFIKYNEEVENEATKEIDTQA